MVNNGIFVLLLVYIFLIISKENEVVNTGVKSTNKHTFSITGRVSDRLAGAYDLIKKVIA